MYKSIKVLEIKTSIVFRLVFATNTFHQFFLLFLITDLYFLIPTVYAQIFNPNAELVMTTETPTNGINKVIKTYPLTVETEIRKMFKVI